MKSSLCNVEFVSCDAYIDQGRKIGDDPVGYKCMKQATQLVRLMDHERVMHEYDVCDGCMDLLCSQEMSQRMRVSFGLAGLRLEAVPAERSGANGQYAKQNRGTIK